MSLNAFITIGILSLDFMIYVLFQWTCGDKRRALARKIARVRSDSEPRAPRPFLVNTGTTLSPGAPRSNAA